MERESNSRVTLDDVCGKQSKCLKKDRLFQNHYRTHSEEKYQCKECPSVWSGGMERSHYWRRVVGTESEGEDTQSN